MRWLLLIALLCSCGGEDGGSPGPAPTDAGAADAGPPVDDGLTHGPFTDGTPCMRHQQCAAGLLCSPAGMCAAVSIGDGECKANADCSEGTVCDERFTRCIDGECGHDLDCSPPHCDINGIVSGGRPTCVECESDTHCASGMCAAGACT